MGIFGFYGSEILDPKPLEIEEIQDNFIKTKLDNKTFGWSYYTQKTYPKTPFWGTFGLRHCPKTGSLMLGQNDILRHVQYCKFNFKQILCYIILS